MARPSPHVPCSVLSLLLLLLSVPLSRSRSILYPASAWGLYHLYYPHPAGVQDYGDPQARQNSNQDEDVLQYCDGAFDIYYLMDSSKAVSNWLALSSSLEDMVEKYVNPNLRMTFILFSTRPRIQMGLTSNRKTIYDTLNILHNVYTDGETYLQKAFREANAQIARANSGANTVSSMIIAVVSGRLDPDAFNETMVEADRARRMGAYIYCIGTDEYNPFQLRAIADSPQHVFGINGPPTDLHEKVDYVHWHKDLSGTQICRAFPSVHSPPGLCTSLMCPRHTGPDIWMARQTPAAKQVVLRGYGFHNAKRRDQVICRFKFSNRVTIDARPTSMNMTTITCPKPQRMRPGQNISVEVSLNDGRDFLARSIRVETTADCNRPSLRSAATLHHGPSLLKTPSKSTLTRPRPTSPALALVVPRPPDITAPQTSPSLRMKSLQTMSRQALLLLTAVPGLLLVLMVLWWVWRLCRRMPKKEPPSPPRPKKEPEEEEETLPPLPSPPPPPPPPTPPARPILKRVTMSPNIIMCCCACRGVCANRGAEGTLILGNFSHTGCHQVPLTWAPSSNQASCTNFEFLKALCAQAPWGTKLDLQPSQDDFPLAYCSQCHHSAAWSARHTPRAPPMLCLPAWIPCRHSLLLPPP